MRLVMHITAGRRQERAGMGTGAVMRSRRFDTQWRMLVMCSSRGSVSNGVVCAPFMLAPDDLPSPMSARVLTCCCVWQSAS